MTEVPPGWNHGYWDEDFVTELSQDYEDAVLESPEIEEEAWIDRHWLLIVGVGLVGIGLVVRWWLRRN
jgi:hypothetical protein